MANFYTDNPSLKHHLHHPLMKRIVELKERGYADKDTYDYAPIDFEDAMDSYEKVLEIVGEICGEIIAPNAEGVEDVYKRQGLYPLRGCHPGPRTLGKIRLGDGRGISYGGLLLL